MATDSFTSTASIVFSASATAKLTHRGNLVLTRVGNWGIVVDPALGVTVSKASSFGGAQSAVTWPVSLNDARALAEELVKAVT